ncbi:unnamed protein product [Symbiodinium microadriaticum]|nr:unnamed protein product [Symbiodinium microadriaticum]
MLRAWAWQDSVCLYMPPTPATCVPPSDEETGDADHAAASSSTLPSKGSLLHGTGNCKPCAWMWKSQGCLNGALCMRCHLCPAGEIKRRKKEQLKRLTVPRCKDENGEEEDEEEEEEQETANALNVLQMGSSSSVIAPLLSATSLPPVPPPLSPPSVNFLEDVVPPAPTWETLKQEPLASVGSALHGTGNCKPCAWFWKPQGCRNGRDCGHCHVCPPGESKMRRQVKLAALRAQEPHLDAQEADAVELPELTWRPPPGLEPCPPPMAPPMPPSLPEQPQPPQPLDFWCKAKSGCGARTAGIVLQPIERPPEQLEAAIDAPTSETRPPVIDWSLPLPDSPKSKPMAFLGKSFGQRQLWTDHIGQKPDVAVDKPEDLCEESGVKRASTLRLPALDGSCPRVHSGVALERLPSEDLGALQADDLADLPSVGSVLHAKGCCSPCAWVWKPQGCHNGRNCGRCHLCPPGEVKLRKKAKAREARSAAKDSEFRGNLHASYSVRDRLAEG